MASSESRHLSGQSLGNVAQCQSLLKQPDSLELNLNDIRHVLSRLKLVAVQFDSYMMIMKATFDMKIGGEPYHARTMLLNTKSGQYFERIWNKTVASDYVGSIGEFEMVCKWHFKNARRLCLGLFQDKNEVAALRYLMSQTPLPRKLSKSCRGFLQQGSSSACEECQKLKFIRQCNSTDNAADDSKSLEVKINMPKRRQRSIPTNQDKDYSDAEQQDCDDGDLAHDVWLNKTINLKLMPAPVKKATINKAEKQTLPNRSDMSDDGSLDHDLWLNQAVDGNVAWGRSATGKPGVVKVHSEWDGKTLVKHIRLSDPPKVPKIAEILQNQTVKVQSNVDGKTLVGLNTSDPQKVPEMEFECNYCLRKCATIDVLQNHMSKAHDFCKDTFRCPICYHKASSVADLVRHMKVAYHNRGTPGEPGARVKCPRCWEKFGIVALDAHFQACESSEDFNKKVKSHGSGFDEVAEGCENEEEDKPEKYFDEKRRLFICPECNGGFEFRRIFGNHRRKEHLRGKFKCPGCRHVAPSIDDLGCVQ